MTDWRGCPSSGSISPLNWFPLRASTVRLARFPSHGSMSPLKHAGPDTWIWLAHDEASYDYCVVMYSTNGSKPWPKQGKCDFAGEPHDDYIYFQFDSVWYYAPEVE